MFGQLKYALLRWPNVQSSIVYLDGPNTWDQAVFLDYFSFVKVDYIYSYNWMCSNQRHSSIQIDPVQMGITGLDKWT